MVKINPVIKVLLFLDCLVNVLILGSFDETLSARAHRMRVKHQPYWYWLADFIDWLFFWDKDHCRKQWEFEQSQKSPKEPQK